MTAFETITDALRANGRRVIERGADAALAQCPVPDHGAGNGDRHESLSIYPRKDGTGTRVCCKATCSDVDVLTAVGLTVRDLFDEPKIRNALNPNRSHRYANGDTKVRRGSGPGKTMWWAKTGQNGGQLLFGVELLTAADRTGTVYLCEGESAAELLRAMGCAAVSTGGAERRCDMTPLRGLDVIAVADRDNPGRKWACRIRAELAGIAGSVQFMQAAVEVAKADVVDHIAADLSLSELVPLSLDNDDALYTPQNPATAQPPRSSVVPPVALLRETRILDSVAHEIRSRGLVGEERLGQTLYLALTSRLLDQQVSIGVKGHSASGKSYTVETVARLFPSEAYLTFTAMSQRALVYSTEQYSHRTLIVYEATALREGVEDDLTAYFVRTLLSEGRIEYPVTVRGKDGGFVTKKIVKEGPTNLIFTTTKTRVHAENETRVLSLSTDDTRAQTARVLTELADERNSERDLTQWHALQQWLASADHQVTIPYAKQLAALVPPIAVRLRRDFGSLLALIRAHAVLHQLSRDRDDAGRIIATLDDYEVVRELVADVIAEGVGATVSQAVRETVAAVAELAPAEGVMARAIAERLRLDKSNASRRLRVAADDGYLRNLEDKRGKPGRWVIGDPLPEAVDLLPDPAQLATVDTVSDLRGCAVAPESEGENGESEREEVDISGTRSADPPVFIKNLPTGPGRCDHCGFHVPTQGHRDGCQQTQVAS